jgi:hypothetical protein
MSFHTKIGLPEMYLVGKPELPTYEPIVAISFSPRWSQSTDDELSENRQGLPD